MMRSPSQWPALFASVGGRKRPDWRFAGRGTVDGGHCPGARSGENHHLQGAQTLSPRADIRRFTPPEPINCAGGVKRSSTERPLCVCSWVIGWPRDGRPCGAISESQTRATSAARAPNPPLISLPCVLGLDEAERPAKAKDSLSLSETSGFATLVVSR